MPRSSARRLAMCALVLAGTLGASAALAPPGLARVRARPGAAPPQVRIRVNQVGFAPTEPKRALALLSRRVPRVPFTVVDAASGRTVLRGVGRRSMGAQSSRWPAVKLLDLSRLRRPGAYSVRVGGARSPVFRIRPPAALYAPLVGRAVGFLQTQRDGTQVAPGRLRRQPSHLSDASAQVYAAPRYRGLRLTAPLQPTGVTRDVSGGWFDAGDYLKFVETASFTDAVLLFTIREYPAAVTPEALAEARVGTDWLLKMWDPAQGVLYMQVGIGDGNGTTILGDHDLWRLPQRDDRLPAGAHAPTRYVARRPVFAANAPGTPISPNLAGRVAAAFALCAQDFAASDPAYARRCLVAGQQLYARADTTPRGHLATSQPFTYYPETVWLDDMALGATELYSATQLLGGAGLPQPDPYPYLNDAGRWVDRYMSSPADGTDSLNLYDVSALAQYDLAKILAPGPPPVGEVDVSTAPAALIHDLSDNLRLGAMYFSRRDPFGLANVSFGDDVSHALGAAVMAGLVDRLTPRARFATLRRHQVDWVLGANPWGSSFVVGAGTVFPHCLAHQVANLSGSLTGRGAILAGATVNGPNDPASLADLGAPDGYRPCPRGRANPFAAYDGHHTAYLDDARSSATSEPGDDFAVLALLAFAQRATG